MQKSNNEALDRILIETLMAVYYAQTVINAVSESLEELGKETSGKDIPEPVRVDFVCKEIVDMFKDPDSPVDKDKFLRGVAAFMLAHQRTQAIDKQTGKSNKKEESNG